MARHEAIGLYRENGLWLPVIDMVSNGSPTKVPVYEDEEKGSAFNFMYPRSITGLSNVEKKLFNSWKLQESSHNIETNSLLKFHVDDKLLIRGEPCIIVHIFTIMNVTFKLRDSNKTITKVKKVILCS